MGVAINIIIKILFFTCIIMQVVLWPSVLTMTFSSALALEGIISYFMTSRENIWTGVVSPGIFLLHGKSSIKSYIVSGIIGIYMILLFVRFSMHEADVQPHMTTWIHKSKINNYSFTDSGNNKFPDSDVTGDVSKSMRENSFTWPKKWQDNAVRLNGTIAQAGPGKGELRCFPDVIFNSNSNNTAPASKYACYAAKLAIFKPPDSVDFGGRPYIPMPSQFYITDVMVTPSVGNKCSDLEVYRIVLDPYGNIEHGLDYPASAPTPNAGIKDAVYSHGGLFSDSTWNLHFQHTFSPQEYASRVAAKCVEGGGSLIFRLPIRSTDIDPSTGRSGLDTLIVTSGASVQLRFAWHHQGETPSFLSTWEQWQTTKDDGVQTWRDSSDGAAVFFKFAIMIIPLLIVWYFLAVQFDELVDNSQVLFLCIFVLLPSTLIFISVGAWLPMAGSIICAIAINHTPSTNSPISSWWRIMIRPSLFFITAACNSIQFAWMLALIGQAGWSAFLYESSLQQLSDLSSKFIISDSTSPTWIGLALPSVLLVNLAFLLGSAICIVLETLPSFSARASKS